MNTTIVQRKDGKAFNEWGQEVIPCDARCGKLTTMITMTGTGLCDACWERRRHIGQFTVAETIQQMRCHTAEERAEIWEALENE